VNEDAKKTKASIILLDFPSSRSKQSPDLVIIASGSRNRAEVFDVSVRDHVCALQKNFRQKDLETEK
jgi:hypothetical protein